MREHAYTVEKALQNGLRPDIRVPHNAPLMSYMKNAIPSLYGAVSPPGMAAVNMAVSWPYPQLFEGERGAYLFFEGTVQQVAPMTGWTQTPSWIVTAAIQPYDSGTPATPSNIAGSGIWQFASFHDLWFATNGTTLLFDIPSNLASKVYAETGLNASALADYNERLLVAVPGVVGGGMATRQAALLASWLDTSPEELVTHDGMTWAGDPSWLVWSPAGGGAHDIPFHTLIAMIGCLGTTGFDKVEEQIVSDVEKGRLGFLPVRVDGTIRALKQLGNDLIVYGSQGVTILRPQGGTFLELPTQYSAGLAGRGAVGGNRRRHVFVDSQFMLWEAVDNEAPRLLGYKDQLDAMTAADIMISYDPEEDHFWITDGTVCFVLSSLGLGGPMDVCPTSLLRNAQAPGLIGPRLDLAATECLTNGDFAAAGGAGTDWTVGAGWTADDDDNVIRHASGFATLEQADADLGASMVTGSTYQVTILLSGVSEGTLTPTVSGTAGAALNKDGVHVQEIIVASGGGDFVLTPSDQFVGAVEFASCELVPESRTMELHSNVLDIGERGNKQADLLQVTRENLADLEGRLEVRYNDEGAFKASPWRYANEMGIVNTVASFVDGKIEVRGEVDGNDGRVESIEVRYKAEDRRARRGTKGIPEAG